jgi:hypothetical protein
MITSKSTEMAAEQPRLTKRTLGTIAAELARHHPGLANAAFSWDRFWDLVLRWPPDVFAFTSLALHVSGAYVRTVSPPSGSDFPKATRNQMLPKLAAIWHKTLEHVEQDAMVEQRRKLFRRWTDVITDRSDLDIARLMDDEAWPVVDALLGLHSASDEACQGIGIPGHGGAFPDAVARLSGSSAAGSLSDFAPELVRVLPNFRTPQCGLTLRSLSFHLGAIQSEVGVRWQAIDTDIGRDQFLNILVIPLPERVRSTDFQPTDAPHRLDSGFFGFFRFAPPDDDQLVDRVLRIFEAARDQHRRVDLIVLPEQSVTPEQLSNLEQRLRGSKPRPLVLAGVRGEHRNFARLWDPGQLFFDQGKHHRWYLDAAQIRQYGLGSVLPVNRKWWEATTLSRRELNFVALNEWLLLCPLICEDLARQEPVASIVRAVGPNLVVALLFDGPQLGHRWSSRYATVLADDPGSSVLCVTCLGMAARSSPPAGGKFSRVIGLWKDPISGMHELELEPEAHAILVATAVNWTREWTADGRSDGECAANLVWGGSWQVQSATGPSIDKPVFVR